ncbi:acetate/propionate family kinase [Cohaesibacter haloalkalitolerans]|uniref:acetate/propionate family kinase n=1 Tax=Cohaesibacter haloalkalitolerans TaxID=1162980 RepID=UPI000E65CE9D|nr:acetate/propionate family kinase [Cohaesibacter haloalkalitolerans]
MTNIKKGALLVLNSGSSSVKFTVFQIGDGEQKIALFFGGQLDGIGSSAKLKVKTAKKELLADESWAHLDQGTVPAILPHLLEWIESKLPADLPLIGAGHRVVHGGEAFDKPVLINDEIIEKLANLAPLAPLHQPQNVAAIKALAASRPDLPQVACFDTAFHRTIPAVNSTFAIPKKYTDAGVRRYGMHGLSYEYIAYNLRQNKPDLAKGKVVVAHLGSGASLSALSDGVSIDTSMGFSALDGIPMGTRPGSMDPGVLVYLMREYNMDVNDLEKLLYYKCGILGISDISNDMRDIEENQEPGAVLALDIFCQRTAKQIASLAVSLGGIDALVFTAGIGENGPIIRDKVCADLAFMGIKLDTAKNDTRGVELISAEDSVPVLVIPTDEEFMIAKHAVNILSA